MYHVKSFLFTRPDDQNNMVHHLVFLYLPLICLSLVYGIPLPSVLVYNSGDNCLSFWVSNFCDSFDHAWRTRLSVDHLGLINSPFACVPHEVILQLQILMLSHHHGILVLWLSIIRFWGNYIRVVVVVVVVTAAAATAAVAAAAAAATWEQATGKFPLNFIL